MMDFSAGAGAATMNDLMPNGQLAWAIVTVRGLKGSASGGQYLDLELTIDEGQPYARKKLWDMQGDPNFAGNSEKYRQMGMIAITRMLEAGRNAGPHNPAGYQIPNYEALNGLRVAIKVGIEKGKDGHDDKNKVGDYLTPNPASASGHKLFQELVAGRHAPASAASPAAAQTGFSGFGAQPTAQPAASGFGGFGQNNQTGGAAAATSGFPQPAEAGATAAAATFQQTGFVQSVSTTTSPSNPAATPGWLAQANQ